MRSVAWMPFLLVSVVAAADLPLEEAAWLPLADHDRHAILPAESRQSADVKRPFGLAAVALTSQDRLMKPSARASTCAAAAIPVPHRRAKGPWRWALRRCGRGPAARSAPGRMSAGVMSAIP